MFVRVDFAAEWDCLAFAFGGCRLQRFCTHRQLVQLFAVLLRVRIGRGFVFRPDDCRIGPEAHLIKNYFGYGYPNLVALRVISGDPRPVCLPRVLADQNLLTDQNPLDAFYAIYPSAEADFQIRRDFRLFRCADGELSAIFSRRRQDELLGFDFVPRLIAGHAVAAVFLRTVVVTHPAFR